MSSSDREIRLRDGRALAYREYGAPRGTPIIHCHGTPSARVEGELTFNSTAARDLEVRVIVPDRPGMGRSDMQPGRRIVDWASDVQELAAALGLDTFAVLGSSGGAPYAGACAALLPDRVRVAGVVGGVAPLDAAGNFAAMSRPLRMMVRLARSAPAVLRGLFRLNLRAMRSGAARASDRMAASLPEPDRSLLRRPEIRDAFMACFEESCRQGPRGAVWDMALMARPWGFELAQINIPVLLWHGERDRNVPVAHGRYLAASIPTCRAMFYPDEAHLSLLLNHHAEILEALAA